MGKGASYIMDHERAIELVRWAKFARPAPKNDKEYLDAIMFVLDHPELQSEVFQRGHHDSKKDNKRK